MSVSFWTPESLMSLGLSIPAVGFLSIKQMPPERGMGVHPSFYEKLQCSVRSFCSILWDVLFVAHLGYLVNEDLGGRIPEPVGDRPPLLDNVDPEKEDIY